ncbi:hypothetical protein A5707_00495 [Mycobacterium kyorinense]|uniref:Uncharacterized protein n=1 Tax=Mycobacterium kyorinense TaxID=487514 RepID=A0A1A2YWI7_9MYCO|nr:hypothetical protein [Mycobacterium kyorinense]OBI41773.1 hypothetical protein A5707_00495 [Mycobacterium kyorinense]
MKALGMVAAAVVAFAPFSAVAASGVAQAAPCAGPGANPKFCDDCLRWVVQYRLPSSRSCYEAAPPRPAPATRAPAPIPQAPPVPIPVVPVAPAPPAQPPEVLPKPPPLRTIPGPTINPPAPGAPRYALVTAPKGLDASPQAIAAAKAAPATRIDFSTRNPMLQVVDFDHQVQNVVTAHRGNVDVVKVGDKELVRPRHWEYIEYDEYHRPTLYNPLDQAMTFRYRYNGEYREAYLPAGGRIVLDVAELGLFPFTAVSDSYVVSGSFYGGAWIPPEGWQGPPPPDYIPAAPPAVYQNVSAYVPADDKTVKVGQVTVVGHDDTQPPGSRDTFLLDDSTLAWGQINDPDSNAQIRVTKTQSLPGAGPTDNGSFLVALAAAEPPQRSRPWWPQALIYGALAIAVCGVAWGISRGNSGQIGPPGP